ncbi:MAG: hypothetical protein DBX58_03570 [Clostridiales bacterium]|nr:MAG: hypothetical protein DBX58_03570 [Clostridiales bacterium]
MKTRGLQGADAQVHRIIAFAIFWVAIGMLLMLFFRYRIFGTIFALILLVASYLILSCEDR